MQESLQDAAAHHEEQAVETPYQHSLLRDRAHYEELYEESITEPAQFWAKIARQYHWETPVCPIAADVL